ncbi:MAG: hypothetical protein WCR55_13085 [Lentisphaerota bacterium]
MQRIICTLLISILCSLTGCLSQRSIVTPLEVELPSNYSQNEAFETVLKSLNAQDWKITEVKPNAIIAAYIFKTSVISVFIEVADDKCVIRYNSSDNFHYRKSIWSEDDSVARSCNTILSRLQFTIKTATYSRLNGQSLRIETLRREQALKGISTDFAVNRSEELYYDEKTGIGKISVTGEGLSARPYLLMRVAEISSSKNVVLKSGQKIPAGAYRILGEELSDGKLTMGFEAVY